jgi:hypothetical protein
MMMMMMIIVIIIEKVKVYTRTSNESPKGE